MGYFFSHLIYVIIAAVIIALVAFLAVVLAEKNNAEGNIDDEKCDFNCAGCMNSSVCRKDGKQEKQ